MSRNGALLADWQDIYNGVNERRKAVMNWLSPASLLPVPFSENHITHADTGGLGVGLIDKIPVRSFCDPSTPLTFQTWDDQYDVGSQPNGVNSLYYFAGNDSRSSIYRYVPQFGSYPKAGYYLAGSGWFLDWIDGALGYMTKAAAGPMNPSCVQYWSSLQWDEYGGGTVWDAVTGDTIPGLVISSYVDLWTYATQNLHEIQNYHYIDALISTTTQTVEIKFSSWQVPHPGVIPADLTLYYSATGDNLGYTPTSYQQSGGPYVHGYATRTKQAASASSPLSIGFTSSVIPDVTPLPGYYVQEKLSNFYAVWDFGPYVQY